MPAIPHWFMATNVPDIGGGQSGLMTSQPKASEMLEAKGSGASRYQCQALIGYTIDADVWISQVVESLSMCSLPTSVVSGRET